MNKRAFLKLVALTPFAPWYASALSKTTKTPKITVPLPPLPADEFHFQDHGGDVMTQTWSQYYYCVPDLSLSPGGYFVTPLSQDMPFWWVETSFLNDIGLVWYRHSDTCTYKNPDRLWFKVTRTWVSQSVFSGQISKRCEYVCANE